MAGSLRPVTKQCTKKILNQMENSFYKININDEKSLLGIFIHFKNENINIPVLIINKYIKFENIINDDYQIIRLGNVKYHNEEYNITILEIIENKNININYLEIDDLLYENDSEMYYSNESIYTIHYNNKNNILVSYNSIKEINNSIIIYNYKTDSKYDFNITFSSNNNKIIGINKSNINNKCILIKYLINEFILEYKYSNKYINSIKNIKNLTNEIDILIKVEQEDIDSKKEIYFLSDKYFDFQEGKFIYCHEELNELNKDNTELYINNEKYEYKKYFIPKNIGLYNIKLKFKNRLKDCSYMFVGCEKIIQINLNNFFTEEVINMKRMFNGCENLKYLYLYSFNTNNVTDMSYMFSLCKSISNLNLFSFNTKNVTDMKAMFQLCENLNILDLSSFNTKKVTDMSCMFNECKNLNSLNILNFDTQNVDMNYMFYNCNKLESLNISSFDTKNVTDMNHMFTYCEILNNLDLSSFNVDKVTNISRIFVGCNKNVINSNKSKFKKFNYNVMIAE